MGGANVVFESQREMDGKGFLLNSHLVLYSFERRIRYSRGWLNTNAEHVVIMNTSEMIARYEPELCQAAPHVSFEHARCTNSGTEVVQAFPLVSVFEWRDGHLPLSFVRELCVGYGAQLTHLHLTHCGLTEMPRELCALTSLQELTLAGNDIHWVHYRLYEALGALNALDLNGNWRLPRSLWFAQSRAWNHMHALCQLDAKTRRAQLYWMTMLRKRWWMARELVALLGQALWSLRGELEHE